MTDNIASRSSKLLRRALLGIVATGTLAAPGVYAGPSDNVILVPPTALPELARQEREAMFLLDTIDGRTLLYIEQNQGARFAILDVTDPGHVKGEGSVQLDAPGPFDSVSALGNRAEVLGEDGFVVASQADSTPRSTRDFQAVDTASSGDAHRVFDVKEVREELTKCDTDTIFLLTQSGLYEIRRPVVERQSEHREQDGLLQYDGGD